MIKYSFLHVLYENFFGCTCLRKDQIKTQTDANENNSNEDQNVPRQYYGRPGRHHSIFSKPLDYIVTDSFIKKNIVNDREIQNNAAALVIQCATRCFLAKRTRKRLKIEALNEAEFYWKAERDKIVAEKNRLKLIALQKRKFAETFATSIIKHVTNNLCRLYAAITIQRIWRGYTVRRVSSSEVKIRIPKRPQLHRRFTHETLKRVWARKHFYPTGGWPVNTQPLEYDMWNYIDRPPKGRDYGVRTLKVKGGVPRPHSTQSKTVMHDRNSWYGLPVSVMTSEEATAPVPGAVRAMLQESPYAVPISTPQLAKKSSLQNYSLPILGLAFRLSSTPSKAARDEASEVAATRVSTSASQLTQGLNDLSAPTSGFLPSRPIRGARKPIPAISTRKLLSRTVDGVTLTATGRLSQTSLHSRRGSPASDLDRSRGLYGETLVLKDMATAPGEEAPVRDGRSLSLSRSIGGAHPLGSQTVGPGIVPHAYRWKKELNHISRKRTAVAAYWTPSVASIKKGETVREGLWSQSSWGKMKGNLVMQEQTSDPSLRLQGLASSPDMGSSLAAPESSLLALAQGVGRTRLHPQSRVKVWPTTARRHYKLRYTWLPQPLVQHAFEKVYEEQRLENLNAGTEDFTFTAPNEGGETAANEGDAETGSVRSLRKAPSVEEIEKEYDANSPSYYNFEADLLSSSTRKQYSQSSLSGSLNGSVGSVSYKGGQPSQAHSSLFSLDSSSRMHPYHFL